jgi:hypothetical protein
MSSKRAQKAKKRVQREARRQRRRARAAAGAEHQQAQATLQPASRIVTAPAALAPYKVSQRQTAAVANPLIGYLVHDGVRTLCDGDGCIIAGSRAKICQIRDRFGSRLSAMQIVQPAPFSDIWDGLQRGGAYCFDEEAYGRFLEPARRHGIPVTEQDFSDPGPLGLHFVRVQWFR